jgi:hypothetical protein
MLWLPAPSPAWLHEGMMKYNFQLNMHLTVLHKLKIDFFFSIVTALWYISTWLYQNGVSQKKKTQKRFGTLVIVARVLKAWNFGAWPEVAMVLVIALTIESGLFLLLAFQQVKVYWKWIWYASCIEFSSIEVSPSFVFRNFTPLHSAILPLANSRWFCAWSYRACLQTQVFFFERDGV